MKTIFSSGPVHRVFRHEAKVLVKQLLKVMNTQITEPTIHNVHLENSKTIVRIRDEFFEHERNPGHNYIFKAVFNFIIALYDYDHYYRHRIDWVIERIQQIGWEPRPYGRPRMEHWYEPDREDHKMVVRDKRE